MSLIILITTLVYKSFIFIFFMDSLYNQIYDNFSIFLLSSRVHPCVIKASLPVVYQLENNFLKKKEKKKAKP